MSIHNKILLFIVLILHGFSISAVAETCNSNIGDGLTLPPSAKLFIKNGYSDINVGSLLNSRYLFLTSNGSVNKCSVLFKINDNKIDDKPTVGNNGGVCNLTIVKNKIVSSWRDRGMWNSNVYDVSSGNNWVLLLSDSCTDCQQVKRIYYENGKVSRKVLLAGGDGYLSRKEMMGVINIHKAALYKLPIEDQKTKSYLVKGDEFVLIDMSEDGEFYQIDYKSSAGKHNVYWIKSKDFDLM